jgi:hypothetical protein
MNRYLVYIASSKKDTHLSIFSDLLSRYLGVPARRIQFKNQQPITGDLVFTVDG